MLPSSFLFGGKPSAQNLQRGSLLRRSGRGGGRSRLTGAARMPSLMATCAPLTPMGASSLPSLHPVGSGGSGRSGSGRSGFLCFSL